MKTVFQEIGTVLSGIWLNKMSNHDHSGRDEDGSCPQLTIDDLSAELLEILRSGQPQLGDLKAGVGANGGYGWLRCDGMGVPADEAYDGFRQWIDVNAPFLIEGGAYKTPDMQGRSLIGHGNIDGESFTRGTFGGEVKHLLTISEMPSHSHTGAVDTTQGIGPGSGDPASAVYNSTIDTGSKGGGGKHNNMPPYFVGNWFVRAIL